MTRRPKLRPTSYDYPTLRAWLDKVGARVAWEAEGVRGGSVEMYVAGPAVFMLTLHADGAGWELFTSPPTNDVAETFSDAEKRIQYRAGE